MTRKTRTTCAVAGPFWRPASEQFRSTAGRLSLEQEQHARSYGQYRQEVAAVGEAETEKRCRQEAVEDQPDRQQQHPQILGHLHVYASRYYYFRLAQARKG
jgi:hypothetical protein